MTRKKPPAQEPALSIIDASKFPIVVIHGPSLVPGDGSSIIKDLESLIDYGGKFVLIIINSDDRHQRQHDEDKARIHWLKENKARLASVCEGFVSVIPDSQRLPLVEKQAAGLQGALGIRFLVTTSVNNANAAALNLLQGTKLGLSN